jgi:hypothetical protein
LNEIPGHIQAIDHVLLVFNLKSSQHSAGSIIFDLMSAFLAVSTPANALLHHVSINHHSYTGQIAAGAPSGSHVLLASILRLILAPGVRGISTLPLAPGSSSSPISSASLAK